MSTDFETLQIRFFFQTTASIWKKEGDNKAKI